MVKSSHASPVRRIGRLVALEAFKLFDFAYLQGGGGLIALRHVVFRGLEIIPVPFIAENGDLVSRLPVVVDGKGMALVTSARGGDCLP